MSRSGYSFACSRSRATGRTSRSTKSRTTAITARSSSVSEAVTTLNHPTAVAAGLACVVAELLISDVRPWGGASTDLLVRAGRIVAGEPGPAATRIDGGGRLAFPA